MAGRPIYGGCLFCCNGRGKNLFGRPSHDAALVQEHFSLAGLGGFFCNGEIGPVGRKEFPAQPHRRAGAVCEKVDQFAIAFTGEAAILKGNLCLTNNPI